MTSVKPTHTPPRSVRVPEELWEAGKQVSALQNVVISDVVNSALAEWVLAALDSEDGALRPSDKKRIRRLIPDDELRRIIRRRTP